MKIIKPYHVKITEGEWVDQINYGLKLIMETELNACDSETINNRGVVDQKFSNVQGISWKQRPISMHFRLWRWPSQIRHPSKPY